METRANDGKREGRRRAARGERGERRRDAGEGDEPEFWHTHILRAVVKTDDDDLLMTAERARARAAPPRKLQFDDSRRVVPD
jgi:hypothetical protein